MIYNPPQDGVDGERASVSTESEDTASHMNQYGFLLNRSPGEGTSNVPPHPVVFSNNLVFDPTVLEEVVTSENAASQARDLDTARRALEQQRREVPAEKERMIARQRQLDEQESRLRHNMSAMENRQNEVTRVQGRHQSRLPVQGETLNPAVLFPTPNNQPIRTIQGAPAVGTRPSSRGAGGNT